MQNASALQPGRQASTPPAAGRRAAAGEGTWDITDGLFLAYLLVFVMEYLGLKNDIPILGVTRLPTLLAWGTFMAVLVLRGHRAVTDSLQGRLFLVFLVFTAASMTWAVVRTYVATDLRAYVDYVGFFASTAYLLEKPARVRRLAVVLSLVILVLVARNLDKMGMEDRVGAFRAGYFLADGNDFGWAMVTLLPFPLYLLVSRGGAAGRALGAAAAVAAVAAIVGTGSRGATVAFGGAAFYYWLILSRRKVLGAVVLAVVAAGVLVLAPASYFDRMKSISHYSEDSSAQARLRAWKAATAMALDHPLGVGAGNFNSAYGRYYMPGNAYGWGARRWISAHSVYFKILGEYGFPGLLLLLSIIGANLRYNHVSIRRMRARPDLAQGSERWPALINMGTVGYALAGLFLGGVAYPHIFVLTGLAVSCRRMLDDEQPVEAVAAETPMLPEPRNPVERFALLARTRNERSEEAASAARSHLLNPGPRAGKANVWGRHGHARFRLVTGTDRPTRPETSPQAGTRS